jgi:hypothetical protein
MASPWQQFVIVRIDDLKAMAARFNRGDSPRLR